MAKHAPISSPDSGDHASEGSMSLGKRIMRKSFRDEGMHFDYATEGPEQTVAYMDGSVLRRPLDLPSDITRITIIFVVLAAIIGGFFLFRWFDVVVGNPQQEQEAIKENLERDSPLELPSLAKLGTMDSAGILSMLEEAGYTIYNKTTEEEAENGDLSIIKLPKDVSLADAGALYAKGISSLSASQAIYLLNGSWTLDVTTGDTSTLYRLRYADFVSETAEAAILNAIEAEGIDPTTSYESGRDESGNTYQKGTIQGENGTCDWGIYVCPLSDMYDVVGLPETAQFVGIRYST